ncbi:DUF1660 family phage protein [Streptomyces hoynatensis]|uniref:Uncharacterized protein n=1 Tax=Streptomyces hoynatensis TaxID=1141874 RepID=A0A3A9YFQ8_9ACTN|nr:DUF1660 family phage protein [Streptomyces hoynatensis]RKN35975.1 hypothetical protein D7294_30560 [Streptomyces hoynatensis]
MLCRLIGHKWTDWWKDKSSGYQMRECLRCERTEIR